MLGTVGSQGSSIQQSETRIKSLNCPVNCSTSTLGRIRGTNTGGKYMTHLISQKMAVHIQPHAPRGRGFSKVQ